MDQGGIYNIATTKGGHLFSGIVCVAPDGRERGIVSCFRRLKWAHLARNSHTGRRYQGKTEKTRTPGRVYVLG